MREHTVTTIRDLLESDVSLRTLQRAWMTTGDDLAFLTFLHAWGKSGTSARRWGLDPMSMFERDFTKIVNYFRKRYKGEILAIRGDITEHGAVRDIDIIRELPLTPGSTRRTIRIHYATEPYLRDLINRYPDESRANKKATLIMMKGRVAPHKGVIPNVSANDIINATLGARLKLFKDRRSGGQAF